VHPHRVLLADPDDRLLATHRHYLSDRGYIVAACGDALGCVDLLRSFRPDLLVLDPDLPWGQGEGVLSLMDDGELPIVPVVLVSSRTCLHQLSESTGDRVWTVLPKPVSSERLEENIRWAFAAGAEYNHVPLPASRIDPWQTRSAARFAAG
jgi:DNA-binding NtrC family response regulator